MAQAEPLTRQGLEESRLVLGEKDPLTLQFMQARASTLVYLGEMPWTELDQLFLQALALHREVLGPDNLATLRLIYGLGLGYDFNFQPARQRRWLRMPWSVPVPPARWASNTRRQPG